MEVVLISLCLILQQSVAKDVHIYVDPNGHDTNSGHDIHSPLKSIHKAVSRASVSAYTGTNVFIELLPGYHDLDNTLFIGQHHANILTIRSYNNQEVHLTGGQRIPVDRFQNVTNSDVLSALPQSARHLVKYVHLPSVNITNFGSIGTYGFAHSRLAPLEVFYNGRPLRVARWPNKGFINVAGIPDGEHGFRVKYNSTRPMSWKHIDDLWTYGYWYWSWADLSAKVADLDSQHMMLTLDNKTDLKFGLKTGHWGENEAAGFTQQGGYFRFINVLSELDEPGEYYLDRKTGNLYTWMPSVDGSVTSSDIVYVSLLNNCITIQSHVHDVLISNFVLEGCRSKGISSSHVRNIQIKNMEIRNTASYAITLGGDSRNCYISKTIVHDVDGGIFVSGGDRKLLESSGNVVEDCEIYRFSRELAVGANAVSLSGVGNLIRYNHMYIGQNAAVRYSGNDHVLEYNHIHHVCMNSSDCGAIHTGRDWTYRGNKIRYNIIHDNLRLVPGADVRGIMLDDQASSATITNNVFYNNHVHANIGGGRDNIISNNVMYFATLSSMQVDSRGLTRNDYRQYIIQKLHSMPYTGPLWTLRYPLLARIDSDNKTLAEGNQIHKNLVYSAAHKEFIHGLNGWLNDPRYYNVTDNGFAYGQGDFNDVNTGDLRLKCHAKEWADHVNFEQVLTMNDVGPRHDIGPSFNKLVHELVNLKPLTGRCPTPAPPATSSPMPAYLPDGSDQTPLFNVSKQGCWLHVDGCTNNPKLLGVYRDTHAESHEHAADNETMCLRRAAEQWQICGSKHGEAVAAIYGPSGATTFAGDGCFVARYGCPNHGGPADGHVTTGRLYRDVYAEQHQNGSVDESRCLSRALAMWKYCGSHPNHTVTSIFRPTGSFETVGAGCWIKARVCPKDPNLKPMFYDAYGATTINTDDSEPICFSRAEDYWRQCGSDVRYPITAFYRPHGTSSSFPRTR